MTVQTYDPKSYELAVHFLQDDRQLDTEENRRDLAIVIQQAIEDWLENMLP